MSEFQGSTLYYFNNVLNKSTVGRGEPVRLFLEDSGIDFEYKRIEGSDWPSIKKSLLDRGNCLTTMPYLVTKSGKLYGKSAPILRRISKSLGKYIPNDADDEYLVDAYADICLDWRIKYVEAYLFNRNNEEFIKKYNETYLVANYTNWNNIYGERDGPYALGEEITYVDFLVYALLRDEVELKVDAEKYPNLVKFIKAFEARPTLKNYFENLQ